MSVHSILTKDFLATLPDDPREAFSVIVGRADEYLAERLQEVDDNESGSWHHYETAQHTVMSVILNAGRRLSIAPFDKIDLPRRSAFQSHQFTDFKADLDFAVAGVLLDNGIRANQDSAALPAPLKDRLRSHISGLRHLIDYAEMTDGKRAALLAKLAEFEAAIEKDRIRIKEATAILLAFLTGVAAVAQLADSQAVTKLTGSIMHTIADAQHTENEQRRVPYNDPPLQLLPPRKEVVSERVRFSADLDDEIPF